MNREIMQQALYLIDAWERGAYAEEYPTEIEALRQALAPPEHPLDKKSDNARELGLDYEPRQQESKHD